MGIFVLACVGVYAGLTYPGFDPRPADGAVLTSTLANFSFMINNTDDGDTKFSYDLYNRSSTSGTWEKLVRRGNISNATMHNVTITMADGDRHYWYVNFTNVTATNDTTITPTSIFNIDTNYYKFVFGGFKMFNFTLDQGNFVIGGNLTAQGIKLENMSSGNEIGACNKAIDGSLYYNGTLWFCNDSSNWVTVQLGNEAQ